jgi:Ser/Thr protein kinase RdoA (MazF antagonist)
MSNFRSLAHGEQLRGLDELAHVVAARFDIHVERRELLQYERNAVYGLTDRSGARYALRISADDGYSLAQQTSELTWLRSLCADGHRVPEPVSAATGELVLEVGAARIETRVCVVFRWLEGDLPSADITERAMAELGVATARLHEGQERLHLPAEFTRPKLGWLSTFGDVSGDTAVPAPYRVLLARLGQRLVGELAELESEPARLLHGDLHRDNVLVRGAAVGFIDFEDCGWGHPLFDVASLLDSFRRRVVSRADYPRARAAFLEAYRPASSDHELTRQLCALKAMRDAMTLRFIAGSSNESVQRWAEQRIAQLVRHIDGYLEGRPARV